MPRDIKIRVLSVAAGIVSGLIFRIALHMDIWSQLLAGTLVLIMARALLMKYLP